MANRMGTNSDEQAEVSKEALARLAGYADEVARVEGAAPGGALGGLDAPARERLARLHALVARAQRALDAAADPKNVELLHATALLSRLLGGGRLIMCKSGKDRTAMAVTLEHARLLESEHGVDSEGATRCLEATRRHGVRRENVRRNVCKRTYAFNWVQQRMLPAAYRPPLGSAKGGAA